MEAFYGKKDKNKYFRKEIGNGHFHRSVDCVNCVYGFSDRTKYVFSEIFSIYRTYIINILFDYADWSAGGKEECDFR